MNRFRQIGLAAIIVLAGCSGDPVTPNSWTVLYNLSVSAPGCAVMDSVKYDDGTGTLIKVTAPPNTWGAGLNRPGGSTVSALGWGTTCSANTTVQIKVTWALSGISGSSDSSFVTRPTAGAFSLSVPQHSF